MLSVLGTMECPMVKDLKILKCHTVVKIIHKKTNIYIVSTRIATLVTVMVL